MALSRRKADRIAATIFVALCVAMVSAYVLTCWPMVRGAFTSPGDIEIAHPQLAIRDARGLIADRARHPEKYESLIELKSLPESLRIAHLRYAKVHQDHVDLVVARNPDWSVGARIWSEQHRPHRDQLTSYPGIYFYRYTNDVPDSPENIP